MSGAPRACRKGDHELEPSGVFQTTHWAHGVSPQQEKDHFPTGRTTTVLYVCVHCRHAETAELQEHWTLEQVQGKRRVLRPESQPWKGYA